MYIKTKTFQITPKELGALLTVDYYRRMKFFFILFAILLVINIVFSVLQNRFDWWLIYCFGLGAYFVSLPLFFQPQKRNSTLNFQNRYYIQESNRIPIIHIVINIVFSGLQNRCNWWLIYFVSLPLFFQPQKRNCTLDFQNRYCEYIST